MIKLRIMGTPNELRWFEKLMHRHKKVKVLQVSERYSNKGTNKYFRVYMEVEKKRRNRLMNTVISAKDAEIMFVNRDHKDFYYLALEKAGNCDVYHKALLYCLGIDKDTRRHVCAIYDWKV